MWWSRKRFYNFDFKVALVAYVLMKGERRSITDCFKDVAHEFDISLSDLKHWFYADSVIRSVAEDKLRAGGSLFSSVKLDVIRAFLTDCRSYSDRYPSYVLSPDFVTEDDAGAVGVPLKVLKIWVADRVLLDNAARSLGKVIDWDDHGGTGCVHDVASASGCDGRPVSVKDPCDSNFVSAAEAAREKALWDNMPVIETDASDAAAQAGFPGQPQAQDSADSVFRSEDSSSGDEDCSGDWSDEPVHGSDDTVCGQLAEMPEEKGNSMDENLSGAGRNRQLTGSSGSASFTAELGGVTVQVRLPGRDMSVTFGNGVLTVRAGDGSVAISVGEE